MRMIIAGSIPFLMLVLIFTGTVWMQKSKSPKAKQMATLWYGEDGRNGKGDPAKVDSDRL